jgi:hypothetical protein
VPGRDFTKIDCSGFVRAAIRESTSPTVAFPDGSVIQHDWIKARGYEPSNDLIYNAKTLESHGGVGPDSHPWTGAGWQANASVYVLK